MVVFLHFSGRIVQRSLLFLIDIMCLSSMINTVYPILTICVCGRAHRGSLRCHQENMPI